MDFEIKMTVMSQIKNGDFAILKSRPCKIVEVMHSKNGKHGSMKVRLVGIDCINKGKKEDVAPGHISITTFKLIKTEYQLLDLRDEKTTFTLDCMGPDSETIKLEFDTQNHIESFKGIKQLLSNPTPNSDILITVFTAPVPSNDDYTIEKCIESYKEQLD